jgi:DNA polymerase I-like protein with 3'-5' exonuclease and polymerase domains
VLVGRAQFASVVQALQSTRECALDTETTGLRPFHGNRLFSLILAPIRAGQGGPEITPYYFNFWPYPGLAADQVLTPWHLAQLGPLFADPVRIWYGHNITFDMHMLAREGHELKGVVYDTMAGARVEYNEHQDYDLGSCGARIGVAKDEGVIQYIQEHGLWEWEVVPGKKQRKKNLFFYKVPLEIIVPYGCQDTVVAGKLAASQARSVAKAREEMAHAKNVPTIQKVLTNEIRLTKTVWRMQEVGLKIDRPYCVRAAAYEDDRSQKAIEGFKKETGRDFIASPKLFAEVFASEKELWEYTDKGNPSFESEVLKHFKSPAAVAVQTYRDAKSKADFYRGFLYHADDQDIVHPNFNQSQAKTGRFSSSNPNFQNLTSEEEEEELAQEFVVRRAIIPRDGFIFVMPDYDQMEYRMMFDYACQLVGHLTEVARQIKEEGKDPHQATADVVTAGGTELKRKRAKNGNFAFLYGSGYDTLAKTIGSTRQEAIHLKEMLRQAMPEVQRFVDEVSGTAKRRGYVFDWAGRKFYFPDRNYAYKAPNSVIQGGCADVTKFAMNDVDEEIVVRGYKSRMIATIHDELPTEVHESEILVVPRMMKEKMESQYPWQYLPLTAGMEWSSKSLADKVKGFPV